jgi:beta-phosphoglucomutase
LIKACIFDLDGVIVDTAHYHYLAWKQLAKELGFDLTLEDNERLKGVSRMTSLNIVLEIGGVKVSEFEKERLANKKNTWFVDYIERMLPEEIFPGVRQLIENLKASGIKVGLASSSKNAVTVIKRLGIGNIFHAIVDGGMITHTKPDPEIFLKTAQLIEVLPEHCLVFEDAEAGVEAALAANMKCIGIGSPEQLGNANRVFPKTGDFKIEMLNDF